MRTLTIGEFKARFSDVLRAVQAGESVIVCSGGKSSVSRRWCPTRISRRARESVLSVFSRARAILHLPKIFPLAMKICSRDELSAGYPRVFVGGVLY